MPEIKNQKRLDANQVAMRLGISRRSVYRLIHAGELRCAAFGPVKGYQILESSVEKYEQRKMSEFEID